ncbi:protein POLR1D isoform X3 [Rhinatrema bivittatum]|uniref:protein POLR1D isoform X3 n=1 Tax=Rhinatrema bivittatum TaxID=194408 RepID=UPI001129BD97|nr:protein POLR1D isoform X3 [Rhinatrema bivittatum]XP_029458460.1 protein POLR1D isoform X3 [Rhinatrema bivittatum]XP_029458461.1 protein POLR1D isoform X3 [Rhinatrema bivittatum]
MDDEEALERKAVEELLKEAKRGKTRAETMGPMGWIKCPLASTNKRFLINTIKNTLPSQKEPEQRPKEDRKESEPSHSKKEDHHKKHRTHPYKRSFHSESRVKHSPSSSKKSKEKHDKRYRKR